MPLTPAKPGPEQAWGALLQIAGAVAGIGALVYVVGAATLWVRFRAASLPADIAVEHATRQEVVALGLRGVFVVFGLLLLIGFLIYVVWAAVSWVRHRGRPPRPRGLATISADVMRRDTSTGALLLALVVGVAAVVASALFTWRAFGVVVGCVAVSVTLLHRVLRDKAGTISLTLGDVAALLIASGFTGFAWQITGHIPVQTAIVDPPPSTALKTVGIPYFGETDDHVFLGDLRSTPGADDRLTYCHRIIEAPRGKVTLTFESEPGTFNNRFRSPATTLVDLVKGTTPGDAQADVCRDPPALPDAWR